MGKRPAGKTKLADARLAGARARLTDFQSREPTANPRLIDDMGATIVDLEMVIAASAS